MVFYSKIILLNKCDLSDEKINREWKEYFKSKGESCILINGTNKKISLKNIGIYI